jgi:hypothetical protein
MNAKQASLLLPGEVVMMKGNPKSTGTVRKVDLDWRMVTIDWGYAKTVCNHNFDMLTFVEKWQPVTEDTK